MLRSAILALICVSLFSAEESAAVKSFKEAIAGDDNTAKRDAIRGLTGQDAGTDWDIIPLLVQAMGSRQCEQWASEALQSRTGVSKPSRGKGGPGYPGFPVTDDAAGWGAWLTGWQRDHQPKKAPPKPVDQPAPVENAGDAPVTDAAVPPPRIPTDDLGKLDRIVYKSGRSLIAYVRSKRVDGDGALVSVRVVHRDGVGEEVIDATVISRIEDDIE
jgi:hypothetical protein